MTKTKAEQLEYMRAYHRKRKEFFKEKGLCPNCQKRPSAEGHTCCEQCLEDKKLAGKFGVAEPYRQLYAELFEAQQGLCGICQSPMKRPVLDHNHETMEVRGLLCAACHAGLSKFEDNPALLRAAIKYVESNRGIGIKLKER